MNIKGFLLFITVAWSLQAGEKRSHEGVEPDHKIVRTSSTDTEPYSMEIAATAPEENPSTIHSEFIALIRSLRNTPNLSQATPETQRLEKLMDQHDWLVDEVLNKAPSRCDDNSIVKEVLKSGNVDLLSFLIEHGLQLERHGNLFSQILGSEIRRLSPEMMQLMLKHKALFTSRSVYHMIMMYQNDAMIKDMLMRHSCIQDNAFFSLITLLVKCSRQLLLPLLLNHETINQTTFEKKNLIFLATEAAIKNRTTVARRAAALGVVRILLTHGANPLVADVMGNDSLMLAQQHNDQELLDILNSYAVQPLPL